MRHDVVEPPMLLMVSKLRALKFDIIKLERAKKRVLKEFWCLIERGLNEIYLQNSSGILSNAGQ